MPAPGPSLYCSNGGAGDVVLSGIVAGGIYDFTPSVDVYLRVGGPAVSQQDTFVAAKTTRRFCFAQEDVGAPDSPYAVPAVHVNFSGAGFATCTQMLLPNFVARSMALGFSEAEVPLDVPQASGGRQTASLPVEAQGAPVDSAANVRNSP